MALIQGKVVAEAGPASVSIVGEAGRLCALWSDELATTVHIWPVGPETDSSLEATSPWATATALGGAIEWPAYEYTRTAGGWLIRLEFSSGQFGYDFIPD